MQQLVTHLNPDIWIEQLFGSRNAAQGGVVRRRTHDIERLVGIDRFRHEVKRRGYTAISNAGHTVIFCNQDPITRL